MKKAFTLIELLVVIGIIGLLAGVMLASFGGGTESARAARCLTNMKNLANACQSYGMKTGRYPFAGSVEYFTMDDSQGRRNVKLTYKEQAGWVSWNSKNAYPSQGPQNPSVIGMCSDNEEDRRYAVTNGCIWPMISRNHETYLCPAHMKKMKSRPLWSYLMNAYFDWNATSTGRGHGIGGIWFGNLKRADRILLFSEVPFTGLGSWFPDGTGSGEDADGVLQFAIDESVGSKGCNKKTGNEHIGFNHKNGKSWVAHVAFADGHCEKLVAPPGGMSDDELKKLTTWLCQGVDVGFNGNQYQKLEN